MNQAGSRNPVINMEAMKGQKVVLETLGDNRYTGTIRVSDRFNNTILDNVEHTDSLGAGRKSPSAFVRGASIIVAFVA